MKTPQENTPPTPLPIHSILNEILKERGNSPIKNIIMESILEQIRQERVKQNEKWGEQNHPSNYQNTVSGEIRTPEIICMRLGIPSEFAIKKKVDAMAKIGTIDWSGIALEEFVEVVAAPNDYERRSELIQLAAVIVQWIECLDRNNRCELPVLSQEKFTDETIMPFGKHKGLKLGNVPAKYLLYLLDENMCDGLLKDYILENKSALQF